MVEVKSFMGATQARGKKSIFAGDRLPLVLSARNHLPKMAELAVILAN
jgi:hypothetical protein